MSALYVLVLFSLGVALVFLGAFFWALRNGQYTDTTTPALRVLFDERGVDSGDSGKEVSD